MTQRDLQDFGCVRSGSTTLAGWWGKGRAASSLGFPWRLSIRSCHKEPGLLLPAPSQVYQWDPERESRGEADMKPMPVFRDKDRTVPSDLPSFHIHCTKNTFPPYHFWEDCCSWSMTCPLTNGLIKFKCICILSKLRSICLCEILKAWRPKIK